MKLKLFPVLLLVTSISIYSCKKSEDSTPDPVTPPNNNSSAITVNSNPQYTFKIDGVTYAKVIDGVHINNSVSSSVPIGMPGDSGSAYFSGSIYNEDTGNDYMTIGKGKLKYPPSCSGCVAGHPINTTFKAFFNPGTYTLGNADGVPSTVKITWTDDSGMEWSTDMGSGNQAGSVFKITNIKDQTIFGTYVVGILATFNCKFYNIAGQSKTVTNGTVVWEFQNI